jgi:hypothetical protein
LAIGSINKTARSDNLFGATFLLTRIIYHTCLTYLLRNDTLVLRVALSVLPVHVYWFANWIKRYCNYKVITR